MFFFSFFLFFFANERTELFFTFFFFSLLLLFRLFFLSREQYRKTMSSGAAARGSFALLGRVAALRNAAALRNSDVVVAVNEIGTVSSPFSALGGRRHQATSSWSKVRVSRSSSLCLKPPKRGARAESNRVEIGTQKTTIASVFFSCLFFSNEAFFALERAHSLNSLVRFSCEVARARRRARNAWEGVHFATILEKKRMVSQQTKTRNGVDLGRGEKQKNKHSRPKEKTHLFTLTALQARAGLLRRWREQQQ